MPGKQGSCCPPLFVDTALRVLFRLLSATATKAGDLAACTYGRKSGACDALCRQHKLRAIVVKLGRSGAALCVQLRTATWMSVQPASCKPQYLTGW